MKFLQSFESHRPSGASGVSQPRSNDRTRSQVNKTSNKTDLKNELKALGSLFSSYMTSKHQIKMLLKKEVNSNTINETQSELEQLRTVMETDKFEDSLSLLKEKVQSDIFSESERKDFQCQLAGLENMKNTFNNSLDAIWQNFNHLCQQVKSLGRFDSRLKTIVSMLNEYETELRLLESRLNGELHCDTIRELETDFRNIQLKIKEESFDDDLTKMKTDLHNMKMKKATSVSVEIKTAEKMWKKLKDILAFLDRKINSQVTRLSAEGAHSEDVAGRQKCDKIDHIAYDERLDQCCIKLCCLYPNEEVCFIHLESVSTLVSITSIIKRHLGKKWIIQFLPQQNDDKVSFTPWHELKTMGSDEFQGELQCVVARRLQQRKLGKKIGGGSFGTVLKYRDKKGSLWAMKKFKTDSSEQSKIINSYITEINIVRRLGRHPNIIEFDKFYRYKETFYLRMPLFKKSLRKFIDSTKKIPEKKIWHFAKEIINGISHLHLNKIIHRDIKSENILLGADNITVKITDFGVSKAYANQGTKTFSGAQCINPRVKQTYAGTIRCMSPEMLETQQYTCKTDIWSYGIVLMEIISGAQPFAAIKEHMLIKQITEKGIPDYTVKSPVCDELHQLLRACAALDPDKRPTAEEVHNTLVHLPPLI